MVKNLVLIDLKNISSKTYMEKGEFNARRILEIALTDFVDDEVERQRKKWGWEFDSKNTINDWVTHINRYASRAAEGDTYTFVENLVKVMAICQSAIGSVTLHGAARRHYD